MIRPRMALAFCVAWLGLVAGSVCGADTVNGKTAFDEYIAKPDSTYSWKLVKTIPGDGVTTYVLDLASQTWRTKPEVSQPVWRHWLLLVKPNDVKFDTALVSIGGGNNRSQAPDSPSQQSVLLAKHTYAVVADLRMIPNQPLVFNQDGKERTEDDLIAYCWVKFMETGDATWLPRFPMVKSVVRAMDATTEFFAQQPQKMSVKKFIVFGGSKRGWTTWMTAAMDPRVAAIVPIVIDVINVHTSMVNHYSAYGFWAQAVGDYTHHKIQERMDTPEHAALLRLVDPYFYRNRFTMPKLVMNSAGDQYFTPDSSKFYFDELPGVKYLRYVPNADHSLGGTDAVESIGAFSLAILKGASLPKFSWKMEPDGSIRVETQDKPRAVNLWQATNPKARDFRYLKGSGPRYQQSALSGDNGVYVAKVNKPAAGWTAFFAELVYESGEKLPYKFTTAVSIVPDTLPHSIEEFRKTLKK
jgi:PhoPQ-activated pathogenicity-related protein